MFCCCCCDANFGSAVKYDGARSAAATFSSARARFLRSSIQSVAKTQEINANGRPIPRPTPRGTDLLTLSESEEVVFVDVGEEVEVLLVLLEVDVGIALPDMSAVWTTSSAPAIFPSAPMG